MTCATTFTLKCRVILDTSPARNIAHDLVSPPWVETFSEMKGYGYEFCLADGAAAELITQRCLGKFSDDGYALLISCLQRFISPTMPIGLGKRDLLGMLGVKRTQNFWSIEDASSLSQSMWKKLQHIETGDKDASIELEAERLEFKECFPRWRALWEKRGKPALDERKDQQLDMALYEQRTGELIPDMDVRNDLQIRWLWRQFVRAQLPKGAYNPESKKKRNDGIDFDLYSFLALPAFVVANDRGFFEKIQDIDSFQKEWFWKPDELAAKFEAGDCPKPEWPTHYPER